MIGNCRHLTSYGNKCNTQLVKRIGYDYYFCPICSSDILEQNEVDLRRRKDGL